MVPGIIIIVIRRPVPQCSVHRRGDSDIRIIVALSGIDDTTVPIIITITIIGEIYSS